jgi:hypothetical protein
MLQTHKSKIELKVFKKQKKLNLTLFKMNKESKEKRPVKISIHVKYKMNQ